MTGLSNKIESPVIFLETIIIFPKMTLPLLLKKPESVLALEEAMRRDGLIIFALKDKDTGVIAHISQAMQIEDGAVKIMAEGLDRVKIKNLIQKKPYLRAKFSFYEKGDNHSVQIKALIRSVIGQIKECVNLGKNIPADLLVAILNMNDAAQLADVLTMNLDLKTEERQEVLELIDSELRLKRVSEFLVREIEILKTGKKLKKDISEKLQKMSKDAYLREQLKSIQKELGLGKERDDIKEYKKKLEKCSCPKKIKQTVKKEISRLKRMPSFSPEVSYTRTYLDWLLELPWNLKDKKDIDLKKAQDVLDKDHYGLEKVKERIIEYLAVQKRVGKMKGPILCFVGPPGTGKTSIGQSVAKALGRKFVRISLGGVRDEAEIRGHRRTYVGALPGRIIQGIKNAGTSNPVFMLDEIDKLGNDFRGDPSSALLEALDPEQNNNFSDHYLEVPYDLSNVMFITTANVLETIPPALRDRLEVIRFSGFTQEEKFCITKKHLFPKLLENHGLSKKDLFINDSAIKSIINCYTYEAGVRNLERELAKICRKTARLEAQAKVNKNNLSKFLGPTKFSFNTTNGKDEVGMATGLAWTEAGGDTLSIEAIKMPGKGGLVLTGSLGRVMRESARAAYSFAKSFSKKSALKNDIHLHVPSGAIPKDGPSAGIAMATVLVSILLEKPIKHEIALTGEVTLRGKALEVGGIKEKVLAAYRNKGTKIVILPLENKKNMFDIPKEIKKKLEFVFVRDMKQVLKQALTEGR